MKLGLNGALTIGTLDGANVEIAEAVGNDNIFIFGKTVEEVAELQKDYNPYSYYERNPVLKRAINSLLDGSFSQHRPDLLKPVAEDLMHRDQFMALADFDSYCEAQRQVSETFRKPRVWWRKSVLNTARLGGFSSDRSIADYAEKIWSLNK